MFTLILLIYAGPLAKGDSVALLRVPDYRTEAACMAEGEKTAKLVRATAKEARFICIRQGI